VRVSHENLLTPRSGLVVLALVVIVIGLAARLTDQWTESQTAYSPKEGNCVYQVLDEYGCVGTASMLGSGTVGNILLSLGVADSGQRGANEAKVPCGSRIQVTRDSPDLTVEKLPGANLVAMGKRININTADKTDLAAIPGIGPQLAARIISERDCGGPEAAYKLQNVHGIGTKKRRALELYTEPGSAGLLDGRENDYRDLNR